MFINSNAAYYRTKGADVSTITNRKNILTYTLESTVEGMPKSRLPELIDKAKSTGLSLRDIQRRAGGQIPPSTISKLHKGRPANVTLETIMALA